MTQFSNNLHSHIEDLYVAGTLSKTGVGRFSLLEQEFANHLGVGKDDIYIVSCARPNNLNIRLTQGRAQHRHFTVGIGILPSSDADMTTVQSGLNAAKAFIGTGNAKYDAVGVVIKKGGSWTIGGITEAAGAGIAAKLQADFPGLLIQSVDVNHVPSSSSSSPSVTAPLVSSGGQLGLGDNRFNARYRIPEDKKKPKSSRPVQILVHGCPGSGKSHEVDKWASEVTKHISIVLHPETTYSDFVGVLRPFPVYKITTDEFISSSGESFTDGEPYITYRFVAGPLLEAYCFAMVNPEDSVALIIEELSRANASLVFGDMLQLLDRVTEGEMAGASTYTISPRPEIQDYLLRHGIPGTPPGSMRFPPNLHIWATMNRSDQNARQIDTAFLRRWKKKHMSYSEPSDYGTFKIAAPNNVEIEWDELRARINGRLLDFAPEDKFIGPYFLPKTSLQDRNAVAEDLMGYLWNDVLKTRSKEFFKFQTLTDVIKAWSNGTENPFKEIKLD